MTSSTKAAAAELAQGILRALAPSGSPADRRAREALELIAQAA